ncbi:MAG: Heparinase family protein, partial [Paenibacillus sp.]|nr:Heparinase family protein [Paenibacillus sp.]
MTHCSFFIVQLLLIKCGVENDETDHFIKGEHMNTTRMDRGKHNAKQPQFQAAMAKMRRDVEEVLSISYIITANEYGDWGHYYHCHHDGTRLQFDWKLPKQHRCPVCGTVWTGEPFDAAWQSHVHV